MGAYTERAARYWMIGMCSTCKRGSGHTWNSPSEFNLKHLLDHWHTILWHPYLKLIYRLTFTRLGLCGCNRRQQLLKKKRENFSFRESSYLVGTMKIRNLAINYSFWGRLMIIIRNIYQVNQESLINSWNRSITMKYNRYCLLVKVHAPVICTQPLM